MYYSMDPYMEIWILKTKYNTIKQVLPLKYTITVSLLISFYLMSPKPYSWKPYMPYYTKVTKDYLTHPLFVN